MLCSNSVQEAMDLALIARASSLETRIPFLHFFDGFGTSHYVASVAMGAKDEHTLKAFLEAEAYDGPSLIIAYSQLGPQWVPFTHSPAGVHEG